jgi:hypothetical protein
MNNGWLRQLCHAASNLTSGASGKVLQNVLLNSTLQTTDTFLQEVEAIFQTVITCSKLIINSNNFF